MSLILMDIYGTCSDQNIKDVVYHLRTCYIIYCVLHLPCQTTSSIHYPTHLQYFINPALTQHEILESLALYSNCTCSTQILICGGYRVHTQQQDTTYINHAARDEEKKRCWEIDTRTRGDLNVEQIGESAEFIVWR
jgi:hypothetical protein